MAELYFADTLDMKLIQTFLILIVFIACGQTSQQSGTLRSSTNGVQRPNGIAANCMSWFDGCNSCHITNGQTACTLKACSTYNQPYCLDGSNGAQSNITRPAGVSANCM